MKRHSPAKAVIDIFSASGTRGLAGHLQTHPFIVAKQHYIKWLREKQRLKIAGGRLLVG